MNKPFLKIEIEYFKYILFWKLEYYSNLFSIFAKVEIVELEISLPAGMYIGIASHSSMLTGFILGAFPYKTAPIPSHKFTTVLKTRPKNAPYFLIQFFNKDTDITNIK